jgi:hypothetical protein
METRWKERIATIGLAILPVRYWLFLRYPREMWGAWRLVQEEKFWLWFVWKLPRTLIYWAVIRMWAHGTMGIYDNTTPNELTWGEALERWNRDSQPIKE